MRLLNTVLAIFFLFALSSPTASPAPQDAKPIPPGFDWPAPSKQLVDWSVHQKTALMRDHAWKLWAGINQPAGGGKLVWETWWPLTATLHLKDPNAPHQTLTEFNIANINTKSPPGSVVSDPNCGAAGPGLTNRPCFGSPATSCQGDYPTAVGAFYTNNGDIMIAGEYYNREAYGHIQKRELWSKAVLRPGGDYSLISPFPHGAVVLKYMGWPVRADGLTALPVWDGKPVQAYWNYNGYPGWKRAVAIDPSGNPIPSGKTASVTYLYNVGKCGPTASGKCEKITGPYGPITFPDAKVVPISAFYHRKIDGTEWKGMDQGDKQILNQSARWAYNRDFQAGDSVVMIAMHINTREMPDWAMQTFWWHDQPNDGPYAENRPDKLPEKLPPGPWRHYLMTTAWNMETPRESDGSPYIAMNPYIELVVPERCRMTTNCQNCHTRAGYPTRRDDPTNGAHYDTAVRGYIDPHAPIFRKVRKTDFQWTLPDRAH